MKILINNQVEKLTVGIIYFKKLFYFQNSIKFHFAYGTIK